MATTPTFQRGEARTTAKEASTPLTTVQTGSGSNTAVTLSFAAPGAGICNEVRGIWYSYSAAPTGGQLTIKEGTTVLWDLDITAAGPGFVPFPAARRISANTVMNIVLAAGGSGIVGKLNADVVAVQ